MTFQPSSLLRALLAMSLSAALVAGLAGCGSPTSTPPSQTSDATSQDTSAPIKPGFGSGANTAQGHYDAVEKAVRAEVPDALFISVQTGIPVTNPSPVWTYLFASKKKNKGYVVTVSNGRVGKPVKLASESIRADEWASVPTSTAEWKVDSDVAYQRAAAAYTKQLEMAPPKKATMGMATFIAETKDKKASKIKPFTWVIVYMPEEGIAVPGVSQIEVDAKTGQVAPLPE